MGAGDKEKKLIPKPAIFFKRYAREIRFAVAGLVIVLTLLFITNDYIDFSINDALDGDSDSVNTERAVNKKESQFGGDLASPYSDFQPSDASISKRSDDYVMPFTDISQKVVHPEDDGVREKATMVTLVRNTDLWELVKSIRHVEDRFNNRYHYDWVFLNDVEFTEEFKRVTSALTSGNTKYGLIPSDQWSVPSWIDRDKMREGMKFLVKEEVLYADSIPYRHMCRYHSGFFWRHPLLDEYDYFWRVDHDITLYCDIQYDIFKFLRVNNKKIGFILSVTDYEQTIPTLWSTVLSFFSEFPEHLNKNNLMNFISDDGGTTYNRCHFWSNFEIGSLEFFRSKAYRDYFDYLDKAGGFFYERWGDAPVHSVAAATILDRSEIHFFDGLGFHHPNYFSCPVEEKIRLQNKCICDPSVDDTWREHYFCTKKYFKAANLMIPVGAQSKTW
ncbi:hypothetical protein Kpol_299p5 [Vanderwaltozyma polyspora DSM 70294]|uniref:Uncharacterized protein n=1 Tax=Vanderwaltozyma polyspora (strain ATCC 22028 / DSM 70294 / BCRC 21397 / CBS 2163 / NBRC 10782 / NRRL Y-8283 / UCD 57-17) TaxID=436907 RepID=A7TSW3_VANPO|nr:uncharacterized protein Kpol_299p5 [Vanderwaltozyma polyspora DSM 70294]EDO14645.1 hypothetical protein Kpol_299p5 [Vanderwaltozyma polyspora DSM 70294]